MQQRITLSEALELFVLDAQSCRFTPATMRFYNGARTRKQVWRYLLERGSPTADEPLFVSERGGGRLTYYGLARILKRLWLWHERKEQSACTSS